MAGKENKVNTTIKLHMGGEKVAWVKKGAKGGWTLRIFGGEMREKRWEGEPQNPGKEAVKINNLGQQRAYMQKTRNRGGRKQTHLIE